MRLSQIVDENGRRALAVTARGESRLVKGVRTTLGLAGRAIEAGVSLRKVVADLGLGKPIDLVRALKEKRVLAPIDCKDAAHLMVSGTGLSHLGSAESRDQMHRDLADPANLTNSMRMFKLGLEGGKPPRGVEGAQPEWFYKGDGSILVPPEGDLMSPPFALDGGEEAEIAGVYVIDPEGAPVRIGFALGNEFSDHVTERQNYLLLAHSKLRPASLGPELLVGDLPADVQGASRIRRGREIVWTAAVLVRRAEHGPRHRQSRSASLQIRPVPHGRATRTSISSARRRCRSATVSARRRATCSRSSRRSSACRCAIAFGRQKCKSRRRGRSEAPAIDTILTGSFALPYQFLMRGRRISPPWPGVPSTARPKSVRDAP